MRFGRSAKKSNIVAVFMLQQRTRMAIRDVAVQLALSLAHVAALAGKEDDIACRGEFGPAAICVAPGRQPSFQLFARGAKCRHSRTVNFIGAGFPSLILLPVRCQDSATGPFLGRQANARRTLSDKDGYVARYAGD
jgi:hypothetical protein